MVEEEHHFYRRQCMNVRMELPDDILRRVLFVAFGGEGPRAATLQQRLPQIAAVCGRQWRAVTFDMIRKATDKYTECEKRDRQTMAFWKQWHDKMRSGAIITPVRRRLNLAFRVHTDDEGDIDVFYADLDDAFQYFEQSVWVTLRTIRGMVLSTSVHHSVERRFFHTSPWTNYRTHTICIHDKEVVMRYIHLSPCAAFTFPSRNVPQLV